MPFLPLTSLLPCQPPLYPSSLTPCIIISWSHLSHFFFPSNSYFRNKRPFLAQVTRVQERQEVRRASGAIRTRDINADRMTTYHGFFLLSLEHQKSSLKLTFTTKLKLFLELLGLATREGLRLAFFGLTHKNLREGSDWSAESCSTTGPIIWPVRDRLRCQFRQVFRRRQYISEGWAGGLYRE